jgi:hypothetical protein
MLAISFLMRSTAVFAADSKFGSPGGISEDAGARSQEQALELVSSSTVIGLAPFMLALLGADPAMRRDSHTLMRRREARPVI